MAIENLNDARMAMLNLTIDVISDANRIRAKAKVAKEVETYVVTKLHPMVNSSTSARLVGEVQGITAGLSLILEALVKTSESAELAASALESWS